MVAAVWASTSSTACTSPIRNEPAKALSIARRRCCARAQQVVTHLEHVGEPASAVLASLGRLGVEQHGALLQDLPDRQRADPAGDQLDGQRQAIEPTAQLGDGVRRDVTRAEVRAAARSPWP